MGRHRLDDEWRGRAYMVVQLTTQKWIRMWRPDPMYPMRLTVESL